MASNGRAQRGRVVDAFDAGDAGEVNAPGAAPAPTGAPATPTGVEQSQSGAPTAAGAPTAEVQIPVAGQPAHVHVAAAADVPHELVDEPAPAPAKAPRERAATAGSVPSVALEPPSRSARASNVANALVHLYRGELGRMTAYRTRLDTTTNWAITTSALATTFALGSEARSHAVFILIMCIDYFFLHLEATRFQAFETSRYLVQVLERAFYPEMLGEEVDPRWTDRLIKVLWGPGLSVNYRGALGWRLRRTYLWIYLVVLLAWLSKLDASDLGHLDFVSRAAVGSVPGWLVCLGVVALYGWLVYVAASARRCYSLGGAAECD